MARGPWGPAGPRGPGRRYCLCRPSVHEAQVVLHAPGASFPIVLVCLSIQFALTANGPGLPMNPCAPLAPLGPLGPQDHVFLVSSPRSPYHLWVLVAHGMGPVAKITIGSCFRFEFSDCNVHDVVFPPWVDI